MKFLSRFIAGLFLLATTCAFAQNARSDGVVFARSGFPAPGASVAVCSQTSITAASEAVSTVTITSTLNPPQGSTVTIVGMTPTAYNGSYTVVTTSASSFTYTNPTQGLGAGTVFGSAVVTSSTPCAPVAALCASYTDTVCTSPNPVTADGLGNYNFFTKPGHYTVQFYGSGLTARTQTDQILACDPANCSIPGALLLSGGSPWIDVMAPIYGAKCDGVTDDTAAINAALAAANTQGGGTVLIPSNKKCAFASQLTFASMRNVGLLGVISSTRGASNNASTSQLIYTGTGTPAIKLDNSSGVSIEGLTILTTNNGFTGTLIEGCSTGVCNTSAINLRRLQLGGNNGGSSPGLLLSLNNTINARIEDSNFQFAAIYVKGAVGASPNFSIANTFFNDSFQATPTTAYLQNMGINWRFIDGNFEIGTGAPILQYVNSVIQLGGDSFENVFMADSSGAATYDWFTFPAQAANTQYGAITFQGNALGPSSANQRLFVLGNNTTLKFTSNTVLNSTIGTVFALGTGNIIEVDGTNVWTASTITNFFTGTPAAGSRTVDNTGKQATWGPSSSILQINNNTGLKFLGGTGQVGLCDPAGANCDTLTFWETGQIGTITANPFKIFTNNTLQMQLDGSTGLATKWGGAAVQGQGLVPIPGVTSQKAETQAADANVLTFTPPAAVGTYRVSVVISVSSATNGIISYTVSWTDSNGNAQSNIAGPLFQLGTAAPNTTFTTSAAGNYKGDMLIDVNNAAAAIVVKWVGGGTSAAKVSAVIERAQ